MTLFREPLRTVHSGLIQILHAVESLPLLFLTITLIEAFLQLEP